MELKVSLDNTITTRRVVSWIIFNFFDSGNLSGEGLWAWKNFSMDHERCRENLNLKSAILSGITGFIRAHRLRFQMHITAHRIKAKNWAAWALKLRKSSDIGEPMPGTKLRSNVQLHRNIFENIMSCVYQ